MSRWPVAKFQEIGGETPADRMKSIMAFLLASTSIWSMDGKKPINPVIGEIIYGGYGTKESARYSEDLPVHFFSEQVSHHPPVNATRLASKTNQVFFDVISDFKFKFAVSYFLLKNHGYARIYLKNYDEMYTISLPDILMQMKSNFLLTGAVSLLNYGTLTVTCEKTGLCGKVIFAEKKFMRNQSTEISGFIGRSQNDFICRIAGDWKQDMFFVGDKGERELCASGKKCPRSDRYFQIFPEVNSSLPYNHSLRLWNAVTTHMKNGDFKTASDKKSKIEHWQRSYFKSIPKNSHSPVYWTKKEEEWFCKSKDTIPALASK
jgi:hypothetical protein